MTSKAAAIVLGIDTPIGLTIVRELGARGVEVHGVAQSVRSLGRFSRYIRSCALRGQGDEAQLVAQLNDIARRTGATCILTVSESDIAFLNRHRSVLAAVPLVAPEEQFAIVLDKQRTCAIAEKVGVEVPQTLAPSETKDVELVVGKAVYPVVLKWAGPTSVHGRLSAAGLECLKAEYCYGPEELEKALRRYDGIGAYPLVQSFSRGGGLGQMIFMHRGRPLLVFQHRRIHEWPPEGGVSTYCEGLDPAAHPKILDGSIRLLREIGWEGAAMVEYRFDETTGRAALMEINGRFWGSLPLAYHAGAAFAWLTYSVLGRGETASRLPPYEVGVKCRYMIPETRRLFTILLKPEKIQDRSISFDRVAELKAFVLPFFSLRQKYYVFTWDDPRPFFADMAFIVRKSLSSIWRRKSNAG